MKKLILISAVLASVVIASCKTKAPATTAKNECAEVKPGFIADIKPIMDTQCGGASGCHSAQNRKHGVDLSSYESTKSAASAKSFLGAIQHGVGFHPMPMKAPKLDDVTIQKIGCWIKNGMPE